MGCSSSKSVDIYRPPPSSFAVFDINSIQEPWLSSENTDDDQTNKGSNVPAVILEKLNKIESDTPHSWDEVSKALEDLKPALQTNINKPTSKPPQKPHLGSGNKDGQSQARKSIHTLEELEANINSKKQSNRTEPEPGLEAKIEPEIKPPAVSLPPVNSSLKNNPFLVRDRLERERDGKQASYDKITSFRRNPLAEFPEKCPPGGADSVVLYTTSLRGVRKTYDDCTRVKDLLDLQEVVYDERDVSLHGEYLSELKGLVGEGVGVPRIFVKGRYIGGVEEVVMLDETGRLGRILRSARVERGVGRQACEGCGGVRFVPCFECGGSCKVIVDGVKERCKKCNENGLVLCPACI